MEMPDFLWWLSNEIVKVSKELEKETSKWKKAKLKSKWSALVMVSFKIMNFKGEK